MLIRIAASAEPGQIRVSHDCFRELDNLLRLRKLYSLGAFLEWWASKYSIRVEEATVQALLDAKQAAEVGPQGVPGPLPLPGAPGSPMPGLPPPPVFPPLQDPCRVQEA